MNLVFLVRQFHLLPCPLDREVGLGADFLQFEQREVFGIVAADQDVALLHFLSTLGDDLDDGRGQGKAHDGIVQRMGVGLDSAERGYGRGIEFTRTRARWIVSGVELREDRSGKSHRRGTRP